MDLLQLQVWACSLCGTSWLHTRGPFLFLLAMRQSDGALQLRKHPNPLVAQHAATAVELWNGLLPEDREFAAAQDVLMEMPLSEAIDRLRDACVKLQDLDPSEPVFPRLQEVAYHLLMTERTMDLATVSSFRRLGAGSFATVFVNDARGSVVVKQVQDQGNAGLLQKEHSDLQLLLQVCQLAGPSFFSLPDPHTYHYDYADFAREAGISRTLDLGLPPRAMYIMRRIWPVPIGLTERIREMFFPGAVKSQTVVPFLARLYLGRASSRANSRFFCSENFPLDAARIEQLGLPADEIAAGMGQMLARINFWAGRDGRDIEFVLCGNASNPLSRHPAFSCIDFNQMRPHDGVAAEIVSATVTNDPYYPRPSSPQWGAFAGAYTAEAARKDASSAALAQEVLEGLRERWADKL